MTDNIDKGEIRKAIDRLQAEHPCHITFDVTLFNHGTDFSVMQRAIDMVAKKCQDDADIHIICEMAKLYLDGVTPTVERPQWIPCSERLPEEGGRYIVTEKRFAIDDAKHSGWHQTIVEEAIFSNNRWCRANFFEVIAWMPLPDTYREEASE